MRNTMGWGMAVMVGCLGCGQLTQASTENQPPDDADGGSSGALQSSESSSGNPSDAESSADGTAGTGDSPGDTDTDTSADTGLDDTAGRPEPVSCWNDDPATWQVDTLDVSQLTGGEVTGVALSGDGLSLVYVTVDESGRTASIATREQLSDTFVGGEALAPWAVDTPDTGSVRFATASARLSLVQAGAIHTSDFDGEAWEAPSALEFEPVLSALVGSPVLYDDALAVMLDVGNGPADADGNATLVAYEARRDDSSLPMGKRTRITMPGWSDETPLLCALPSPDGRYVVFGGAFPAVWSDPPETLTSALDIWVAERDGERSWNAPVEVDVASHDTLLSCPTSITDNGCLMTIRHFELGVGTAQFSVARR